jgi:hypothetical protein
MVAHSLEENHTPNVVSAQLALSLGSLKTAYVSPIRSNPIVLRHFEWFTILFRLIRAARKG